MIRIKYESKQLTKFQQEAFKEYIQLITDTFDFEDSICSATINLADIDDLAEFENRLKAK